MFEQELAIYKRIQESPIITIWGHGLPDGDCYGCQIGLREILRAKAGGTISSHCGPRCLGILYFDE